jgi:hypothetical protein
MTPDDRFLIKASEHACEKGTFGRPVNRHSVGKLVGMREKGTNNTVKLLAKANFVLKVDEELMISVTEKGQAYVEKLQAKLKS